MDAATDLQTRNVFVDTSIFRKMAFDLTNESLKKLGQLGQEKKVFLYSTFITAGEIEKNLQEAVGDSFNKAGKINVELRNAGLPEIDVEALKEARMARWREFISRSNATMVAVPNGSIEEVFDLYFTSKPPFNTKANKRNEFPDAFVLAALKNWCEENGESMYVVADDVLLLEACKETELLPLKSLEEFIDLYNKREEFFYALALSSFKHLESSIEREILEQIEGRIFDIPDLWDADVSDVEPTIIELRKPLFIEVNEEFCLVDIDASIGFSAYLTCPDRESSVWDSETKELMSFGDGSDTVSGSFSIKTEIKISFFESGDPKHSDLDEVKILGDIRFRVVTKEWGERYEMVAYPHPLEGLKAG